MLKHYGTRSSSQTPYGKGPADYILKVVIFPILVYFCCCTMALSTELENDQYDSFITN